MKKTVVLVVLAAALNAVPSTAFAGCFEDLGNCYQRAAGRDSWGSRWLAGLDCELDFVDCGRRKLIGR
ncbi:MAG: hypothetical protein M3R55_10095 [Acidobacteriota bacterium]|nr:hypothetical protein [Acidobacteriota bacterium]